MNDSFAGTNVRKTNNVTDTHHSLSLSLSLSLSKFCSINQNFITSLLYPQITLKIKIKISPIFLIKIFFLPPFSQNTSFRHTHLPSLHQSFSGIL